MRTLYFLINLAAFALMGLDKAYVRRGGWRVPEKTLFGAALLGVAVGGTIGVFFFRHKTRHWYFRYGFPALAAAQVLGIGWLLAHWPIGLCRAPRDLTAQHRILFLPNRIQYPKKS